MVTAGVVLPDDDVVAMVSVAVLLSVVSTVVSATVVSVVTSITDVVELTGVEAVVVSTVVDVSVTDLLVVAVETVMSTVVDASVTAVVLLAGSVTKGSSVVVVVEEGTEGGCVGIIAHRRRTRWYSNRWRRGRRNIQLDKSFCSLHDASSLNGTFNAIL